VRDGTLVIEFLDARTGQRIWRGTATDSVVPAYGPAAVEGSVAALLARYPPRAP
jgi:hypothetical protein